MIEYHKSAYGLSLLLRMGGSAVFRSMILGVLSAICVVLLRLVLDVEHSNFDDNLQHPYAIGVLVASITFLLVFRVQQGYARYWEACSAVHHMMSKWMDAVSHTAAYHMQCSHYDSIKPPSFFDYPHLNEQFLTRSRERTFYRDISTDENARLHGRASSKSIEPVKYQKYGKKIPVPKIPRGATSERVTSLNGHGGEYGDPQPLEGPGRMDGNWSQLFKSGKATYFDPNNPDKRDLCGFAGIQGGHTPPLFLQELAHLTSLMNGVALSTLRNDIEGATSPLDIYEPGSPWPAVDVAKTASAGMKLTFRQKLWSFLGAARSPEERTQLNAARPLSVLGGVSEGEIRFLQMARGPSAKTQLAWYWLSEFIVREHLAGTLGKVGPPIISRIIQFLGDGMIHYNHARKIMYIPFPFPHAQLSVFFILAAIPIVAILMEQFSNVLWVSSLLAFLTVTCLSGIHEVARELENPFRNVPNEIPLVTLQAQFNEALVVMYAGYHPDHFWKDAAEDYSIDKKNGMSGMAPEHKTTSTTETMDTLAMQESITEQKHQLEMQQKEIDFLRQQLDQSPRSPIVIETNLADNDK